MSTDQSLEARLEEATVVFQKLQSGKSISFLSGTSSRAFADLLLDSEPDLSKAVEARQRLDSQRSENEGVLKVRCSVLT
jgi:hypothetical protein